MSVNSKAGGANGSRASDEDGRTSVKVGECSLLFCVAECCLPRRARHHAMRVSPPYYLVPATAVAVVSSRVVSR